MCFLCFHVSYFVSHLIFTAVPWFKCFSFIFRWKSGKLGTCRDLSKMTIVLSYRGLPGGSVLNALPANSGDAGDTEV